MFGVQSTVDIKNDLLGDLGLGEDYSSPAIEALVGGESRWIKDLRVNLKNVLKSDHLSNKETALLGLAVAVNQKNDVLQAFFTDLARNHEATDAEIGDATACASLLAANNVFYRFRHFVEKESYSRMPARIKMTLMAKPKLEKEFFELVSLAVSAVNGCEMCVSSHEQSVLKLGSKEERVFDAVRLVSIVTSLDKIVY